MTFDAIFVPDGIRGAVSDLAWLEAMLEAERALAAAEAAAGVIPSGVVAAIAEGCRIERIDPERVLAAGRASGNPAEPLVRALRETVGGEAADYVHFGATSQDIIDTAAMLVARRALGLLLEELDRVADACAGLAGAHRATPMAARTLLQQAVPTTFGLKAAGWLVAVVSARGRLRAIRDTGLAVQLGGAAGTLAALGADGLAVIERFAAELDLPEPVLPWHTDRTRIAELGSALATGAGVCAKIGLDVALLEQIEVGELREAAAGGSTTMPQKRNPVGSALAFACARRAAAAASMLTAGLVAEHERPVGAWHAEWGALSDALASAGGAAAAIGGVLGGLEVDAARMRANLELGGGAVMSERLVFLLTAQIGREEALSRLKAAIGSGRSLGEELAGELPAEAFEPDGYLGSASDFIDRALAVYREEAAR
ncbi:MAG TPA: 3-carboxy-cis,cis-muconate cycloisomerase [Gaiellaceae bacterium]|nr:3-carboxy-cis,cis-muconate cycloisomerase [Gaiellaceae bacterium]